MDNKHPVSRLQERMAKSCKALPTYTCQQLGYSFVYTVNVDGITVLGTGFSKTSAKYNAASRALSRLGDDDGVSQPLAATRLPSSTVSGENYIGALNEIASKHKLPPPVYSELVLGNNTFRVECQLLGSSTQGYATIKKQAKQHAAKDMCMILNARLPDLLKQKAQVESITEQFEMFKNQGIAEPENKANNLLCETASSSVEEMSTKQMWSELQKYVSVPLLQIIQSAPDDYVLSLNIDDDCKTTILEIGKTYQETELNLLKKALFLLKYK